MSNPALPIATKSASTLFIQHVVRLLAQPELLKEAHGIYTTHLQERRFREQDAQHTERYRAATGLAKNIVEESCSQRAAQTRTLLDASQAAAAGGDVAYRNLLLEKVSDQLESTPDWRTPEILSLLDPSSGLGR